MHLPVDVEQRVLCSQQFVQENACVRELNTETIKEWYNQVLRNWSLFDGTACSKEYQGMQMVHNLIELC
ncbi:hypothetical protein Patl1_17922 [Pistacia atlantica]|uniref:Uncharacterized protein n=1 Tax=Pistacia atlantica TaxID=434234 RepID=A0ACC1C250_9ROSI|nr:hypothetical protein Patl1_17922 [Pistacia atlantica]